MLVEVNNVSEEYEVTDDDDTTTDVLPIAFKVFAAFIGTRKHELENYMDKVKAACKTLQEINHEFAPGANND